jgi:hypothetical protein
MRSPCGGELSRDGRTGVTIERIGDLDIQQNIEFQQREWVLQRIAWVVIVLILIAACLGLFGHGLLSGATAESPGGELRVSYDRFDRRAAPSHLEIKIAPGAGQDGRIELWIERAYLERAEVRTISPEPESGRADDDRFVYVFSAVDPDRPQIVTFQLVHDRFGRERGELGLIDGPSVALSQFVFP